MRCFVMIFLWVYWIVQIHASSIEVSAAREIRHYTAYNQLPIKKIISSLDARDIIFYLATDDLIWMAMWRDSAWITWPLLEKHTTYTDLVIELHQIDGQGSEEVIIRWEYIGKIDFIDVVLKGVQIWNTDDVLCYLDEITVALEQRFLRESDLHYYAGCERKILVNGNMLEITPFRCDYDLGVELIDTPIHSGIFYFSEGKYRKKETGSKK